MLSLVYSNGTDKSILFLCQFKVENNGLVLYFVSQFYWWWKFCLRNTNLPNIESVQDAIICNPEIINFVSCKSILTEIIIDAGLYMWGGGRVIEWSKILFPGVLAPSPCPLYRGKEENIVNKNFNLVLKYQWLSNFDRTRPPFFLNINSKKKHFTTPSISLAAPQTVLIKSNLKLAN